MNWDCLWLCLQTRDCYWRVPYFFCLSVQLLSLIFIKVPVVKFTVRINISDLSFFCFYELMVWYFDCEAFVKLGQLFSASFVWVFCKMSEIWTHLGDGISTWNILSPNLLTGLVSLTIWISSHLTMNAKVLYYCFLYFCCHCKERRVRYFSFFSSSNLWTLPWIVILFCHCNQLSGLLTQLNDFKYFWGIFCYWEHEVKLLSEQVSLY